MESDVVNVARPRSHRSSTEDRVRHKESKARLYSAVRAVGGALEVALIYAFHNPCSLAASRARVCALVYHWQL